MCHTALFGVYPCTTQVVETYIFIKHLFDHIGTGYKHVAGLIGHKHKVGDRGRVNSSTRSRTQDNRYLRDNP